MEDFCMREYGERWVKKEFQLKDATTLYYLPFSSGPTELKAKSNGTQIGKWTAESLVRSH
jgi:hypothetical protein